MALEVDILGMSQKERAHIFVSGRVQGVFFRARTRDKAKSIGVAGWVRNLPDGRVEIMLEGGKDKLAAMINWLKKGSLFARVDGTDVAWEEYKNEFNDFEIKYDL